MPHLRACWDLFINLPSIASEQANPIVWLKSKDILVFPNSNYAREPNIILVVKLAGQEASQSSPVYMHLGEDVTNSNFFFGESMTDETMPT